MTVTVNDDLARASSGQGGGGGGQSLEKATGADINAGTNDAKYATPKAIADSNLVVLDDLNTKINGKTDDYTLGLTDAHALVRVNAESAKTVTVPANGDVAFKVGVTVHIRQVGAGQVTISGGDGVTINTPDTLKLRTQHSMATLIKVGTDEWDLVGDLEAAE
jgi:hypothetical protein